MKKLIFVFSLIIVLVSCGADNPKTPKDVIARYFDAKTWPNKVNYLGTFFLKSNKTIGEQLASAPEYKDIEKTLKIKHKDVLVKDNYAVIGTEYIDANRQFMIYSFLSKQGDNWKIKAMIGLPQDKEVVSQYNFMHSIAIKNDNTALQTFKNQMLSSDLLFSEDAIIKNLALLFIATDSDMQKFFDDNYAKIDELKNLMTLSSKSNISASKSDSEKEIANKLANLPAFGVSKYGDDGVSIMLINSQVNSVYLIYQPTKDKVVPVGGSVMQVLPMGKDWYLYRVMSDYTTKEFKKQSAISEIQITNTKDTQK